ncbi:MAG TPA: asparaginase [Longimicrobiales bacterium]|nr:asparaginase [Longimicrobiales bacterium]
MTGRIRVTRGEIVESEHRVHAVVHGSDGPELVWGDAAFPTTLRSAAKLFQALPLVEDGVADALPLSDSELALCCASHNTETAHVEGARAILARVGLDERALACGPHRPLHPEAARRLDADGISPSPIHNNCSGKHAGMLALATHHGWETAGYHRPDHPVQRRMRTEVARWSGLEPNDIPVGIDGCGIPCYGLPLDRVARAFRRFGAGESEGATRLLDAIGRAPFMIGGTDRLCSWLPEVTNGRIVAKVGAEGVYGAVVRDLGVGVAVKVEDGSRRAVEPALMAVLESLGALAPAEISELEPHRSPRVTNTRDEVVGEIRFVGAGDPVGAGHPVGAAAASGRGGP